MVVPQRNAQTERAASPVTSTMSVVDIRLFGDPVLRTPAVAVTDFDKQLRKLVQDLSDTMMKAPGVGLAAPQIGVGLRVFTYYVDGELGHLINPDLSLTDETEEADEGVPVDPGDPPADPACDRRGGQGVRHVRRTGGAEGTHLLARCVQHETDHLDGVLFIDRLDPARRKEAMKMIRESDWFGPDTIVKSSPHTGVWK